MSNKIEITTPYIELDSFLKFTGLCYTGGEAKLIIKDGLVSVNGQVCTMLGKKLYPGDRVTYMGATYQICQYESN